MVQWAEFPIGGRLWLAGDETLTRTAMTMLENVIPNDAGSYSRFPGIERFASFPSTKTYVREYRGELYAGTETGRLWRITAGREAVDVTGTPVSGGQRWTFAETEDALLMAAGGPIIQLSGNQTKLLSPIAPSTTHVAYMDGYAMALQLNSNRWNHSSSTDTTDWDPLDYFAANAVGENANFLVVTPYREILIGGPKHIEQWETLPNGDRPFDRRFPTGQGCAYPYTLITDATGTYGVNARQEFVRFAGQISQEQGEDIGMALAMVDDWSEAWGAEMSMFGSRLMCLVAPNATNFYGTRGLAFCFDYRAKKFSLLYGPIRNGVPTGWPVTSFARCYNKVFCGVPGGVGVFDTELYQQLGEEMMATVRSPHVDKFGPSRVDKVRLRLKRGTGIPDRPLRRETHAPYTREPGRQLLREAGLPQQGKLGFRVNRDNKGFDRWQWISTGAKGQNEMVAELGGQGSAHTWQFEFCLTDGVPLELVHCMVYVERLKW